MALARETEDMSNPLRILKKLNSHLTAPADDLQDVQYLLKQEPVTADQLNVAFDPARVPDIREIKELFERAKRSVLATAAPKKP